MTLLVAAVIVVAVSLLVLSPFHDHTKHLDLRMSKLTTISDRATAANRRIPIDPCRIPAPRQLRALDVGTASSRDVNILAKSCSWARQMRTLEIRVGNIAGGGAPSTDRPGAKPVPGVAHAFSVPMPIYSNLHYGNSIVVLSSDRFAEIEFAKRRSKPTEGEIAVLNEMAATTARQMRR